MNTIRPVHALLAIVSPQLGPTRSALIFASGTFRSLASSVLIWSDFAVSTPEIWMRRPPVPSSWTIASCPEAASAERSAVPAETLVFGVVKTAPPSNSMPMFRPRTARPTMAVMVIRIEMPYQILRLPMKS